MADLRLQRATADFDPEGRTEDTGLPGHLQPGVVQCATDLSQFPSSTQGPAVVGCSWVQHDEELSEVIERLVSVSARSPLTLGQSRCCAHRTSPCLTRARARPPAPRWPGAAWSRRSSPRAASRDRPIRRRRSLPHGERARLLVLIGCRALGSLACQVGCEL